MFFKKKVVTRFAPSPTGFLHVGGVRTALYAWLLARKNKGTFILRIEDTDKEREVEGSIGHIIESLKWLGLEYDYGPDKKGPHGSCIQSERLPIYKKYAETLIQKGHAYADPYTEEEVEKFRKEAEENKKPFLYREHRPKNEIKWNGTMPLRFKVPEIKQTNWHDLTWGDLTAGPEALDDFILIKSDGYPTYNFAHIVDDIEMGVTHVVRGQEFISSTPKFLSVYETLGIKPPFFVTTPPILGEKGTKKLSKRDGAKDILDYRAEGYLPDAMINYLAFLGFNPGGEKEVYTREELMNAFDLDKVQRSGAKWNDDKLDWLNREHMKKMSPGEIEKNILKWMPEDARQSPFAPKLIPMIFERIYKWSDVKNVVIEFSYLFQNVLYENPNLPVWKDLEDNIEKFQKTSNYLKEVLELIKPVKNWDKESLKNAVWSYVEKEGKGNVLWPMRFALSVREKSPDPFMLAEILGREETIVRITRMMNFLPSITLSSQDFLAGKMPDKTESTLPRA